jgi:Xaa-His dipeptidase
LVIYVPASAGYEDRATLILQGHLDMVWQKTPESTHDFEKDPIQLIRDGDWIHANGTTLGADNGIGMALMMSLVEDESVKHPPLELLFTVEEEMGVVGADSLDPALLSGKTLINVDSETEGVFTVGCAGGGTVIITLPVSRQRQQNSGAGVGRASTTNADSLVCVEGRHGAERNSTRGGGGDSLSGGKAQRSPNQFRGRPRSAARGVPGQ